MMISATLQQEQLLKALVTEGEEGLEHARQWLEDIDLEKVDGGSYRLIPMLYKKLICFGAEGMSGDKLGRIKGIYRYYFYKNNLILHQIEKILRALNEAGIRFMLLKGAALIMGGFYADYALRPMNDIDILVDKENMDDVLKVFTRFGWRKHSLVGHAITLINDEKNELDLHWYALNQCSQDGIDADLWRYAQDVDFKGISVLVPSPTDQIWYNCAHGFRYNTLPPIRWIVDVKTVLDKCPESVEWQRLIAETQKRRLTITLLQTLLYFDSLAPGRVPEWVTEELGQLPVSKSEKNLYEVLCREQSTFPLHWALHSNYNDDKSFIFKVVTFPAYIRVAYGLKTYLEFPRLVVKKLLILWSRHQKSRPNIRTF